MKRPIALLLALAIALGGASALAEATEGETRIRVPGTSDIVVPAMPEIDIPDVPGEKATKAPEIEIPKIPRLDIPQVQTGLGLTDPAPTPPPAPTATPAPTEAPASAAPEPNPADPAVEAALDALGNEAYRKAYEALLAGGVVRQGTKGAVAKGVQLALIALGQGIAADGNVGPKTLAALEAVQGELGLEKTRELNAAGYGELLKALANERREAS